MLVEEGSQCPRACPPRAEKQTVETGLLGPRRSSSCTGSVFHSEWPPYHKTCEKCRLDAVPMQKPLPMCVATGEGLSAPRSDRCRSRPSEMPQVVCAALRKRKRYAPWPRARGAHFAEVAITERSPA